MIICICLADRKKFLIVSLRGVFRFLNSDEAIFNRVKRLPRSLRSLAMTQNGSRRFSQKAKQLR